MKSLFIIVFAFFGYVVANCGCLKCSKHLHVVGEIPGGPGQLPLKIIYRTEPGYPSICEPVPVQPIAVQVPVPKPEPVPVPGAKYPIQLRPFCKPFCSEGPYYGWGAINGAGAASNPCTKNVYDYDEYYGPIVPVKVQTPVEQPEKPTFTLQGLKTGVDRIILPCPVSSPTGIFPYDQYVSNYPHGYHGYHHHHHCGHSCSPCHSSCSPCHSRYDEKSNPLENFLNFANHNTHSRSKRQIFQHGYKFIVNMLPPFIQEPIKDTVNRMAITHPDKKLRKVYNLPPPPLTLKEKIELKHKENVAALKQKLFGKPSKKETFQATKKYYVPARQQHQDSKKYEKDIEDEAENFIDSIQAPEPKKQKGFLKPRSKLSRNWLKEMKSSEILENYFPKKFDKKGMTEKEKDIFLQKLRKLNQNSGRYKRDAEISDKTKRSIIIGSDELDLPLYRIKIRDSGEDNEIDDADYDYDYDYNDENSVGMGSFDASREEMIRNAIREELKKFREVESEEDLLGDPVSLFGDDKMAAKYPLLRILTFPMKLLKKMKNNEELPIVGAVPKIIVGTKKYFKDFGKNFKKNFLHFTSDIIGDFDHDSTSGNLLANIIKTNRLRRSVDETNQENFRKTASSKVRKKRYILKMVDDDEIELLLRQKLGKMFEEPPKKRRKYRPRPKMHRENSIEYKDHYRKHSRPHPKDSNEVYKKKKPTKKAQNDSYEDIKKTFVIEPIKPKVIIDNNGLPFMEVNGYKRPLFMKNFKKPRDKSTEDSSYDNYDSSEEVNLQQIHQVIDKARNGKHLQSRNLEMPLETVKDKMSQLLYDIDTLVHMDFEKYDAVYDDLIEMESVKNSIVQSWKRIVIKKKINDYEAKIGLLEKFEDLQHLKSKAMHTIVGIMQDDCENNFSLKKIIQALMALHKIQCIIDQVVNCFNEKFKTGSKFDLSKEIKFVDFLSSLKFVQAKTRNDMVCILKEERDKELQENIVLLEKLKKILVEGDESLIEEEANILWEMKHVQKLQLNTIAEMHERLQEGLKIKKNMKVLFDLMRRLKELAEKEKKLCSEKPKESCEEKEGKTDEEKKKIKKFDIEEFKKKWKDKVEKQKEAIEENFKKRMLKIKELKEKVKNNKIEDADKSDEELESDED